MRPQKSADSESCLRARIAEPGGEVAALPTIEHDELLAWDMRGKKPSATTGKSYGDAVIRATVLECVTIAGADNCVPREAFLWRWTGPLTVLVGA